MTPNCIAFNKSYTAINYQWCHTTVQSLRNQTVIYAFPQTSRDTLPFESINKTCIPKRKLISDPDHDSGNEIISKLSTYHLTSRVWNES